MTNIMRTGWAVGLLLAAMAVQAVAVDGGAGARQTLCFNPDWRFIKADPAGAARPEFNDADWEHVSTPHTFNDVDTYDNMAPAKMTGEIEEWTGRTWYRKSFTVPDAWRGKIICIEFEGARQVSEIYLNGKLLGGSRNGFVPFGFNLTPHLREGGRPNVLAVMCDNRFDPVAYSGALPWNHPHWNPVYGGLYRNVWLHVLDPVHITLPLFSNLGTMGAYVYATNVTAAAADVGLQVQVQNESAAAVRVTLKGEVLDRDGAVVLKTTTARTLAAGGMQELSLGGRLDTPQRWEPVYPYLYCVRLTLEAGGRMVDAVTVPLGVRSVKWDVNTGFWINERHVKLHGWAQQSSDAWAGIGGALPDWMHDYTVRLMRDAGGNFIRWFMCSAGPAQIAAGDRLGQVTINPGVDCERDTTGEAWKVRAAAFRDMIIYYRNHPSILLWEGGNQKVTGEHAHELRGYMDKYDPHGGRGYAQRRADKATAAVMDVSIGTEGSHEQPQLPVVEGEYNREEAPRRVWDRYTPPWQNYHAVGTYDLTAEQFAANQVAQYVRKLGGPSHCGGAKLGFSDIPFGGRLWSEVSRSSSELDGVRLPKEAYFACAAMWRAEPAVHIIGHWNYPAGTVKPIYVVSNGEKVELFVNGKSQGFGNPSDRYLFTFAKVQWEPGEIKAVASHGGRVVAGQVKRTAGPPLALRLTPITGPAGFQANGSDVALVDVEAVDQAGNRCPTFYGRVDFEPAGPGIWRGGYNSGKEKTTNNSYLDLECGINRVSIRSTYTPGTVTLQAHSAGLKPAAVSIEVLPVAIAHGILAGFPPVPAQGPLTPPPPPVAAAEAASRPAPAQSEGAFIKEFSYSGPTAGAAVQRGAVEGKRIYPDRDYTFTTLPDFLTGADYIQLPSNDRLYTAADLIVFAVKQDGVVYIAHDDRLRRPAWLTDKFTDTGRKFKLSKTTMSVFQMAVRADETVTLGSNTENTHARTVTMYVVFVQGKSR